MKRAFDHIGVWTTEPQADERWVANSEVWVTNPRKHPARIEYLRAKKVPTVSKAEPGLWKLWHYPHIAYRVDDLDEALKRGELVLGPFEPGDFVRVAFVIEEGAVVEYMQYSDLSHWFGEPNPPDWQPEEW